jgi:hypothetical protein
MILEVTVYEEVVEEPPRVKVRIHRTPDTTPMVVMQASVQHLDRLRRAVREKRKQMYSFERRTCWSVRNQVTALG